MSLPPKLRKWTPAQIASLGLGIWWLGNAMAVFAAAEPAISSLNSNAAVSLAGVSIAVNGWHGLFHLLTGLAAVISCRYPTAAKANALSVGTLYVGAALCSLITGPTVFGLLHVDALGSADHAVEGVVLLAAGLLSIKELRRSPAAVTG